MLDRGGTVGKTYLGGEQTNDALLEAVIGLDAVNCFSNLVSVGAHVLYRGCPRASRDPGQSLDTGEVFVDAPRNKVIPDCAGPHTDDHRISRVFFNDARNFCTRAYGDDSSIKWSIGCEQV